MRQIELQPLTTVAIPYKSGATNGLVTQPQPGWIDTEGFNIADVVVEVYAYAAVRKSAAVIGDLTQPSNASLSVLIEAGTTAASIPIKDPTSDPASSGRGSSWLRSIVIALSEADTNAAQKLYASRTQYDNAAGTGKAPLQRLLRWSITNTSEDWIFLLTFRVYATLRNQ